MARDFYDRDVRTKVPRWYELALSNIGKAKHESIYSESLLKAQQSGSRRTLLGTVVPTFVLAANTHGDFGYALPVVTGVVAFGAGHLVLNNAMGYAGNRAQHNYEIGVNRAAMAYVNPMEREQYVFLSERIKANQKAVRRLSVKHFLAASFLTAAMSAAAASPLADSAMGRVQKWWRGQEQKVQLEQQSDPDVVPRSVFADARSTLQF